MADLVRVHVTVTTYPVLQGVVVPPSVEAVINPDDLARAIREGVDARLRDLALLLCRRAASGRREVGNISDPVACAQDGIATDILAMVAPSSSAPREPAQERQDGPPATQPDEDFRSGDPGDVELVHTAAERHAAWVAAGKPANRHGGVPEPSKAPVEPNAAYLDAMQEAFGRCLCSTCQSRVDAVKGLRAALAAARARAQAAEARAAMLEREAAAVIKVWQGAPARVSFGRFMETALGKLSVAIDASPSPLAQAIERVLEAWRTECLHAEWQAALDALRTAWRGAEPGETT